MIDTAISDITHDGLINFDKRRKEFEVLAQIKLLQGAANAYHIETDAKFNQWFEAVLTLDEREAFDLSCKVPFIYYVSTFKEGGKVIRPKYYKHLKKKVLTKAIWADKKWACFWQISLYIN